VSARQNRVGRRNPPRPPREAELRADDHDDNTSRAMPVPHETPAPGPRRIAVFGRPPPRRRGTAPQTPASSALRARARLRADQRAGATDRGAMFDRAVGDGTITLEERDELLRELADRRRASKRRRPRPARIVLTEAFAAIRSPRRASRANPAPGRRRRAPDDAQSTRILERLRSSPAARSAARTPPPRVLGPGGSRRPPTHRPHTGRAAPAPPGCPLTPARRGRPVVSAS